MFVYVQAQGSTCWHWCRNCSRYPSRVKRQRFYPPTKAKLCDECRSKERSNDCTDSASESSALGEKRSK
jgi:hypothetical protein